MAKQATRSAGTRNRIIEIALEAFANNGYVGASLADIVREASVTTGALYHHFDGKRGLFQAVAEHLEQVILDEITAKLEGVDVSWGVIEQGVLATLEICARPDIQRIVFRDAPNVVGQAEWRAIEMRYGFGVLSGMLQELASRGEMSDYDPQMTAQILLGAIMEAAHAVAVSDSKAVTLEQGKEILLTMVRALGRVK